MADQLGASAGSATASQVLSGITFSNATQQNLSGSMPNNGSTGFTPSGSGTVAIPAGYYDGSGTVAQVSVPAGDVLSGITIAGIGGTMPNNGSPTFNPSTSSQTLSAGYYSGGTVSAVTGTATAAGVLSGDTFSSASGIGLAGSMPNNGALSYTPSTSSQTIPAGYTSGGSVASATLGATGQITGSLSGTTVTFVVSGLAFQPSAAGIGGQYSGTTAWSWSTGYNASYVNFASGINSGQLPATFSATSTGFTLTVNASSPADATDIASNTTFWYALS